MVYLFGILGLLGGFMAGLIVINIFLQNVSKQDLLNNRSYRWTYGLAVWIFAGIGCYGGVWMHGRYFTG